MGQRSIFTPILSVLKRLEDFSCEVRQFYIDSVPIVCQDLRSWTIFGGAERPQKSSKALVFRGQCVSPGLY